MEYYKNKKSTEAKVGVFFIIAVAVLFWGYFWITDVIQNSKYTQLQVRFGNAGNLEKGSSVSILGVECGKVKQLRVDESGVILNLLVRLNFPLKEGTEFHIMETDIMGGAQVDIIPGNSSEYLDLNKIHSGLHSYGISTLISELSNVTVSLQKLMTFISGEADEENFMENFKNFARSSTEIAEKLNTAIDKNSNDITVLISNAKQVSAKINELIDNNKDSMTSAMISVGRIISKVEDDLIELRKISENISVISGKMRNEDSSFNRMISERELYDNLIKTTAAMDSLLKDIKKNPKKYFTVKVF